jgi:hypothetical protein
MLFNSPESEIDVALCPAVICVVGGFVVPQKTSYVKESPSISVHDHSSVGEIEVSIAAFEGTGLLGIEGGLFIFVPVAVPLQLYKQMERTKTKGKKNFASMLCLPQ